MRWKNEACLYVKQEQRQFSYIPAYVDDLIILCPSENDITEIKKKIASNFKMHDGGPINYFLAWEQLSSSKHTVRPWVPSGMQEWKLCRGEYESVSITN